MLQYIKPDCALTLREGIQELRQAEGADGDLSTDIALEIAESLDLHDAVHVLFACRTTVKGEILAHAWTLFGTNVNLREMHRVTTHRDHAGFLRGIGHKRLVREWAQAVPKIWATFRKARRMKKRWQMEEFARYMDRPLADIRREFGIAL